MRRTRTKWLLILLLALPFAARADSIPKPDSAVSSAPPLGVLFANLPTCGSAAAPEGARRVVTDENDGAMPLAGGGTGHPTAVICRDGAWVTQAGFPILPVNAQLGDYTVQPSDAGKLIFALAYSGPATITLPAIATVGSGFRLTIVNVSASNAVTIAGQPSEPINGASTLVLSHQYDSSEIVNNGALWVVRSGQGANPPVSSTNDGDTLWGLSDASGAATHDTGGKIAALHDRTCVSVIDFSTPGTPATQTCSTSITNGGSFLVEVK